MRTIKELLQLMLDNKHLFEKGLCHWAIELYSTGLIEYNEMEIFHKYITNNKPKFQWYNLYMLFNIHAGYYWKQGCITPRIKWLKHHINSNK